MSTLMASVRSRLESIIATTQVSGDPASCQKYAVDGVLPSAIVKPTSAAEVAEVVKFAFQDKLALIPCGGRTKLGIGMPPSRYDIALDMTGLNQIAHYDHADLTLSVDAGMGLAELANILGEHHQFVPLAVPFFQESTIGGTIASSINSILRPGYGSPRDFIIGAEFVNGAGAMTKSGGRVVKNVTGYDLHKLLIGSLGTLAVITRLNFRTFPSPEGHGHLVIAFDSVDAILRFQSRVAKSYLQPSSFEILDEDSAERLAGSQDHHGSRLPPWFLCGHWHVCIAFEGTEAILGRYSSELIQYAQQSGAANYTLLDDTAGRLLHVGVRELLATLLSSTAAATIFKINLLPTMPRDVLFLRDLAASHKIPWSIMAGGSGPSYFTLLPKVLDDETIAALAEVASAVFEFAGSHAGNASILFSPTELKRRVNIWGPSAPDAPLMRRLKTAFDPHNIFAPGRFVAGI